MSRTLLQLIGIVNGLEYCLLAGTGIFILSSIFRTVSPLSKKKTPEKHQSHPTKPSIFKKHIPDFYFPKSGNDSYLIEIRIVDRRLKTKIKGLEDEIVNEFGIKQYRFVPHISLAGGLSTSNEKQLISVFTDLCSKTPVMKFQIKGFSAFEEPKRVIYFDINPCENLKQFRFDLSQRLKIFCKLKPFDFDGKEEFVFHSTLTLNVPELKFKKIQEYVKNEHYDSSEYFYQQDYYCQEQSHPRRV
ncbi:2'-5' RNA ligase family protein [Methanoregula sp.]|uniref:2'-5' RNA ligase family protein n=1 Tax=Methanoregula sp. TaxID=2052170 RepID=UPI002370CFC7|nr:2'-5' RNA ligase family protein [Methanoregula sp.]MDD1686872.1 2'-5' RNA ligase family protein [Methanoregula sp.]